MDAGKKAGIPVINSNSRFGQTAVPFALKTVKMVMSIYCHQRMPAGINTQILKLEETDSWKL